MKERFLDSFPVQLFLLHLRKNLALVMIWAMLTVIVLEKFGVLLGIPFLFLDPEYLHQVSWLSFFLMGIGIAIFTMAFHMTTYIMEGRRFKFLAVVKWPFIHFCINNSIIPLFFYLIYTIKFVSFQLQNDPPTTGEVAKLYLGFAIGSILAYFLVFGYFGLTNKNFFLLFSKPLDKKIKRARVRRKRIIRPSTLPVQENHPVKYFLNLNLRLEQVSPDISRYDTFHLLRVFNQNHLNLFLIQVFLVSTVLILGTFKENEILEFPAAMSATLLLAILIMSVGAISFWLRKWAAFSVLVLLLLANYFSNFPTLRRPHEVYGIDYSVGPTPYTVARLDSLAHPDTLQKDKAHILEILENWKSKLSSRDSLPKLILVSASGGGQRAALWTFRVLQELHSVSDGRFTRQSFLYTGASGGVLGQAFFREIYLRSQTDPSVNPLDSAYLNQISSDNLNPIIFSLLVNDLLIRNQKFEYKGRSYLKDRGFAFENQLNKNTKGILDKSLDDYREPESLAQIPLLPVTSLVTNDGRKLVISPHSMSFLGSSAEGKFKTEEKKQAIDFRRFFADHDPGNLRFLSALRMGASFPFISPAVELPSNPVMKTMDTGLADNFGIHDALRFVYVFQEWIAENTGGVVLITIRDSEKSPEIPSTEPLRLLERLVTPLRDIYVNWDNIQTIQHEALINFMAESLPFSLERIEFEYAPGKIPSSLNGSGNSNTLMKASLNWRLTTREKKSIISNLETESNQRAVERVKEIVTGNPKK